ncbi:MAG: GNAT family N-acetyltransferase [Bacteroidales bacterium]
MNPASPYIDLIENNLADFYSAWGKAMNIPVYEQMGMRLVYAKGRAWPAFALFPVVPEGSESGFAALAAEKMTTGEIPSFLICTNREENKVLMNNLENAGFRPVTVWSGMARELDESVRMDESDHFHTRQVQDPAMAAEFAQLINREVFRASLLDADYFQSPELASFHAFAGSLNEGICSTSSFFSQGATAGLYFIATLPSRRRQGLGRRMTLLAMQEAKKHGCNKLVLHATSAGRALYEQIGFVEYCKLVIYWLPG